MPKEIITRIWAFKIYLFDLSRAWLACKPHDSGVCKHRRAENSWFNNTSLCSADFPPSRLPFSKTNVSAGYLDLSWAPLSVLKRTGSPRKLTSGAYPSREWRKKAQIWRLSEKPNALVKLDQTAVNPSRRFLTSLRSFCSWNSATVFIMSSCCRNWTRTKALGGLCSCSSSTN